MYILTFIQYCIESSGHYNETRNNIYIGKENMRCIYSWLQWKANISKYQILTYMYTIRKKRLKIKEHIVKYYLYKRLCSKHKMKR